MGEPDSTPRRRPPTIDLTATEVEPEKPDTAKGHGPSKTDGARTSRNLMGMLSRHAAGAFAGVVAVCAIIAGFWFAGYLPLRAPAVAPTAAAPKAAINDEISARLDRIETALQGQKPEPALAERIAAAQATTKSLGDSLAALGRRVDDVVTVSQNALAQAKAASIAVDGAKSAAQAGVQRSDLDALAGRIASLESAVKTLGADITRRPATSDDQPGRLFAATQALRAAVERGAPYQAELAAAKALGADANTIAPLEPFAATGVPSLATLAQELSKLTAALAQASGPKPSDGSLLGRLEANAQKLVRITAVNAPAWNDSSSIVAHVEADAIHADIAGALADIARLPEPLRNLADSWVKKVDARNAALAASQHIFDDGLAALRKPNPQ